MYWEHFCQLHLGRKTLIDILFNISVVMDGDNILAAILIIHGPKPSILVALVESSLLINDKTW